MQNQHIPSGGFHHTQIVQHAVTDRVQRFFSSDALFHNIQCADIRDIQNRFDIQHGTDKGACIGHTSTAFEIIQVIDCKAMCDFQFILFAPVDHFRERLPLFHQRNAIHHQQTQSTGNAAGIHHIKLLIREFFFQSLCSSMAVFIGYRHLFGHIQEKHILPARQQSAEEFLVSGFIDLRCLENVAVPHSRVDRSTGLFPAVIHRRLIIDRKLIRNKRYMVFIQPGARQITGG